MIQQKFKKINIKCLKIVLLVLTNERNWFIMKLYFKNNFERGDSMAIHVKAARVNAGLSQDEAAKELKISKSTLISYEKYKTVPSVEMSKRMADLYGMSVDDIIFYKETVL